MSGGNGRFYFINFMPLLVVVVCLQPLEGYQKKQILMVPTLYLTAVRYSDIGIPPKHVGEVKVFITQSVMSNSFQPHGL